METESQLGPINAPATEGSLAASGVEVQTQARRRPSTPCGAAFGAAGHCSSPERTWWSTGLSPWSVAGRNELDAGFLIAP